MHKILPALGLLTLITTPALAQQAMTKDPSKAEAGSYSIEPAHTRILFGVSHFGFTTYYGEFRDVSGTLSLDPNKPESSAVEVKVATASVLVPNEKLLGELKGDQWLDATKDPEISFKSDKVVTTGPDTAKVSGEFTLHGVTKPLTLDVKFNAAGPSPANKVYTAGFDATGKIKRSDFGVKTYVPIIGDDVDMMISAAFVKQK